MFARVSIYEIPEERANDATKSFEDAIDTIAALRGLTDAYFLISREGNKGLAMTLWDNYDAMAASRVTGSRLRSEAIRAVDGTVISVDEFEVAAHVKGPVQLKST